jgi:hypothetical protein
MRVLLVVALLGAASGAAHPAAAQDRWQLTLHSDTTLWDLELKGLTGDTLLVRQTDSNRTLRVPVMQIDELRLVQAAEQRAGMRDGRAIEGGLMGTTDLVFHFTLRGRDERLDILREILKHAEAPGP